MMHAWASATILIAAATMFAVPAAARIGDVRTVPEYGSCMYAEHPGTAMRLLDASTEIDSDRAFEQLRDEKSCFARLPKNSSLSMDIAAFSKGLMRGLIAEAGLRSSSSAVALAPLPLQQKRYIRPWFVASGRDPAVDEMAACVADTNPQGIVALLATSPQTSPESYAIGALSPSLQRCLAARTQLHADRTALRAALADALYQRMRDPALSMAQSPAQGH
jgi:hypothetical protein